MAVNNNNNTNDVFSNFQFDSNQHRYHQINPKCYFNVKENDREAKADSFSRNQFIENKISEDTLHTQNNKKHPLNPGIHMNNIEQS